MSNTLALSGLWHEGSIASLQDDKLVYLANERLTRHKYAGLSSVDQINSLLDHLNISIDQMDYLCWIGTQNFQNTHIYGDDLRRFFLKHSHNKTAFIIDHHNAHQASTYYTSPYDEAIILSLDDVGDGLSARLAIGRDHKIDQIGHMGSSLSVGRIWEAVNILLGFNGPTDSGKTMALTAWGSTPEYYDTLLSLIEPDGYFYKYKTSDLNPDILQQMFGHTYNGNAVFANYLSTRLEIPFASPLINKSLGTPRSDDIQKILNRYYNLVQSVQALTTHIVVNAIEKAMTKYHIYNVCLAGGVALNGITNTDIFSKTSARSVHIPPMVSDCGLSIGGVLWAQNMLRNIPYRTPQPFIPYSGPIFSTDIETVLDKYQDKIIYTESANITYETASLIAKGNIVGWYQGASEIGPRALGNRSILAHPGIPGTKDRINRVIKKRESFRPFAPSVLYEQASEYFDLPQGLTMSPYMLFIATIKEDKINTVSEILHEDNTGRLQTVHKNINPLYYDLISEFYRETGIPMLLNTSFNDNAEPIVHTPEDAIICFLENNIDVLVLEKYIIRRLAE